MLDAGNGFRGHLDGPDCRLWVDVRGEGAPVTVFAHGITSSSAEVGPFARRTPGTRVLFDFRGHGRSDSPPRDAGYGFDAMRRDLEFVADRYGATQAMGVSLGAGALLHLLADQPQRFRRLVFFLPAALDRASEGGAGFPHLADLLEAKPLEEVVRISLESEANRPLFEARPKWRNLMRQRILRMNSTGVPRALRVYAERPVPVPDPEVLRRVAAPALILAHEGDPLHEAAIARRIAELLPNAELRVWPEPMQMLDDVGEFARMVGEFLDRS